MPTGFVNRAVLPIEIVAVENAVIENAVLVQPEKVAGYQNDGLRAGEAGVALGRRSFR
jgi:hypothetical protein